jgi:peroxiredoxin
MKRKIALTVAVLVVGAIAFMGWRVWRGAAAKRATAERIQTLPAFEARTLGGQGLSASDFSEGSDGGGRPLVFMYFRTTCRFCRNETESIKQHEALRRAAPVVMVSSEGREALQQFEREYGLAEVPGVRLARDTDGSVAETFGVRKVPATFVYGADGRLVEHFQGEASAGVIYAALRGEGVNYGSAAVPDSAASGPGGCGMGESLAEAAGADSTSDCSANEN